MNNAFTRIARYLLAAGAVPRHRTHSRRRAFLLGLAGASAGLAGCTSLVTRDAPVKQTFLLDPPLPTPVGTGKPAVLRIGAINVAAAFRGKAFVYRRSDLAYESDYYNEFFVPPATMFADAAAKALAAAKVFERVVPAGAAGNDGDYLLDGFVSAFYGDVRDAAKTTAELTITFYLSAMGDLGAAPLWSREYTQQAPIARTTPDAFAQAQNAALGALLGSLVRDLSTADLSRRPAGAPPRNAS